MGHAFICEHCDCYHTATDACEDYEMEKKKTFRVMNYDEAHEYAYNASKTAPVWTYKVHPYDRAVHPGVYTMSEGAKLEGEFFVVEVRTSHPQGGMTFIGIL